MNRKLLASFLALFAVILLGPLTAAQDFTQYMNTFVGAWGIAPGLNGSVWFTTGAYLSHYKPDTEELSLFALPSSRHSSQLAVDTTGAAWVCCGESICRVSDAGEVQLFLFPGSDAWTIAAAPDGSVWASRQMPDELMRFADGEWQTVEGAPTDWIPSRMCFEADGTGWFAFSPDCSVPLAKYKDGNWTSFPNAEYSDVVEMTAGEPGEIWIVGGFCVTQFRDGEVVHVYRYNSGVLAGDNPISVAVDQLDRVWIGDGGAGVAMFDRQHWITYNTLNSGLPSNFVGDIASATDGTVWFATLGGLACYKNGLWAAYTGGESTVMNNDIWSVAIDTLGRTFYGTAMGQVGYFDGARWNELYKPQGSSIDTVYDIAFGQDGTVWLACDASLKAWKGLMINYRKAGDGGVPLARSTNLCFDQDNNLWVCAAKGLAKYDGASWKSFQTYVGSPPMAVTPEGLACDLGGRIWVGTSIGLAAIKDDQLDEFLPQYQYVHTIECDNDGMLWLGFGSSERGVLVFDGEHNEEIAWYTTDDGLPSNAINCIACDEANNVWVGTNDGLAYFDGTEWTMWDIDSGLPVNEIRDIAIAPNGDVWFATPNGLLCHESGVKPPGPSITISTDSDTYHIGDTMTVTLSYENPGPDVEIDIQIGCMLPDGSLFYYPGGDVPVPFSSGMLPSGTTVPMVLVLSYEFPEGFPTGQYTWLAVICEQGTFNFLSDISSASFTLQ